MSSGPTSVLTTTTSSAAAASSTMRTPTLQPVPESLPADHVSSSANNGAGNSGSESRASASAKKKVRTFHVNFTSFYIDDDHDNVILKSQNVSSSSQKIQYEKKKS